MALYPRKKIELSPKLKFGVGRGHSKNQLMKYGAIFCFLLTLGLAGNAIRLVVRDSGKNTGNSGTPQVLGASDTRDSDSSTTVPTVKFVEYKIQKGDTLFNVSQRFNINWTTLATLNNLKSPFTLKPGQTLKVPQQ